MTLPEQSNSRRIRWYIRRHRVLRRVLSAGPVRFMGAHSGKLWWDIRTPHGWLIVHLGRFRPLRPKLPRVYWSPNGTPWHHRARSIFRAGYVCREECVCREPDCTMPKQIAGERRS